MSWFRWLAVGKVIVEAAAELLIGQVATVPIVWKGTTYTVTIKRG